MSSQLRAALAASTAALNSPTFNATLAEISKVERLQKSLNATLASASMSAFNSPYFNATLAEISKVENMQKSLTAALASASMSAFNSPSPGSLGYSALIAGLDASSAVVAQNGTWEEFQEVRGREEFPKAWSDLTADEEVVARVAEVVGAIGAGAVDKESGSDELDGEGALVVEVTNADFAVTALFVFAWVYSVLVWLNIAHPDVYDYVSKPGGDLLTLVSLMLTVQAVRRDS